LTTVLISAPYLVPRFEQYRPLFESYGLEIILIPSVERMGEEQLLAYAGRFDGAISGDDRYTARVLAACAPRLKVISKWGTGIDSIDLEAATNLGIKVYRTPNAFTLPVADTVLGYILAFARRQPWMDRAMKAGCWEKIAGRSLSECVLGVVGVGLIGKAVLRRGRAFGMQLLGNDIIEIDHVFLVENGIEMTSLEDLLSRADFVSLNCDLNPTSYHLINHNTLAMMKRTAILINAARGSIVDERALIAALEGGIIAGAALDVFEVEPLPDDSPLMKMDQVLLAPHNANSSPSAWERVHKNTIRNLLEGLGLPLDKLMGESSVR
jgi:D-3-phosphoglycerate dehydrogenase / 2-oxoglutarate reductase